jgi:hypothetical protein
MKRMVILLAFLLIAAKTGTSHASYKFCADWSYQFTDQGQGEDYLLHSGSTGKIAAARAGAFVFKNDVLIWMGNLDTSGCTATLAGDAGHYVFSIIPGLTKGSTKIEIYPTSAKQWRFFNWDLGNRGAASGAITIRGTFAFGDPLSSVAAVMTQLLNQADMGLVGQTYTIFADQNCPGGGDACYCPPSICSSSTVGVYLGTDIFGSKMAFNKTTVAHEMGHHVQDKLTGLPNGNYDWEVSTPACRCDHVVIAANRAHCLQSYEKISSAEVEGWAQFYAADLFNNPTQSDGWFAYYKEFFVPGWGTFPPPVKININTPYKWNVTNCSTNSDQTGVELDWQTFLYELNNKGTSKFTYSQLRDVYKQACGATFCDNNDDVTMNGLALSVIFLYGLESAKTAYWASTANKHLTP